MWRRSLAGHPSGTPSKVQVSRAALLHPYDAHGAVDVTTATQAGQAGLQGWRAKFADRIAKPVANHTNLNEDQVRAVVGAAFFILSVIYVVNVVRALAQHVQASSRLPGPARLTRCGSSETGR